MKVRATGRRPPGKGGEQICRGEEEKEGKGGEGERKEEPSVTKSSSSSIFTSFASRWHLGRFVFYMFLPLSGLPML